MLVCCLWVIDEAVLNYIHVDRFHGNDGCGNNRYGVKIRRDMMQLWSASTVGGVCSDFDLDVVVEGLLEELSPMEAPFFLVILIVVAIGFGGFDPEVAGLGHQRNESAVIPATISIGSWLSVVVVVIVAHDGPDDGLNHQLGNGINDNQHRDQDSDNHKEGLLLRGRQVDLLLEVDLLLIALEQGLLVDRAIDADVGRPERYQCVVEASRRPEEAVAGCIAIDIDSGFFRIDFIEPSQIPQSLQHLCERTTQKVIGVAEIVATGKVSYAFVWPGRNILLGFPDFVLGFAHPGRPVVIR